jgi:hypothetical protein
MARLVTVGRKAAAFFGRGLRARTVAPADVAQSRTGRRPAGPETVPVRLVALQKVFRLARCSRLSALRGWGPK